MSDFRDFDKLLHTTYPYPQQPTSVSNAVASQIDTLLNAGFDSGKILDIYRDSQLIKQYEQRDTNNNPIKNQNKGQNKNPVKNPIKNPLQYLRKIRGLSDEVRKIRYSEVENIFNSAISSWKSISPLSFLKQYHAHIYHSKNNSGLECGMIHHRIINAADPTERIIIIDASTEYLEFCCSDDNTRSKEVFFYFSDDRIKDILKFESQIPKNFHINSITQLSVTSRSTRILLFGNTSKSLLESIFNKIHELYAQKSNYVVYAVLPSTYIENSDFSKFVVSKFLLLEVAIIDSAAVNISPTKRCIVSLSTKYGYNQEKQVPFQLIKKEVSSDSENISLQCSQPVNVDLSDILAGQQTLNKLYASAINKHAGQRKQPNVHMFSPEILIYYSFVTLPNGHLRAKYSFYGPPTPSQLRRNTIPRGKGLCTGISGKVVPDLDGITNYADELLFTHDTLPGIVRKTIKEHYRYKPISLKTAWYTYLPEIDTKDDKSRYDEEICSAIFLNKDNRIASLKIHSEASADDISAEISQYCRDNNWSDTKTNRLYNQVLLIWSVAHQHRHTESNPLQELVSERQEKQDLIYDLRDALVVRSFSRQNMYNLNTMLDNDSENPVLALMMYLRTYLRLDSGEVGALTLGDYVKCPNANFMQLIICKTLPPNGHTAIPLTLKWENRVLPVPAFLQDKLDDFVSYRYSQLIELGISEEGINKMPLFPGNTATQPFRRKAVTAYCTSMLRQLEMSSIKLDLPDAEKLSDVGHYYKDILQTNWDYHIKQIEGSANILSADDICYLSGKKPITTLGRHYNDHLRSDIQLNMRIALDEMIASHRLLYANVDDSEHLINIGTKKRQCIAFQPYTTRTEIIAQPVLSENDVLDLEILADQGCTVKITQKKETRENV